MKLLFKQRFFSWFDSYDIYNEAGEMVYIVKGKLSWRHCLKIYDAQGSELGRIRERVFCFMPQFEMYLGNKYMGCQYIGCIRKEFTFLYPRYKIEYNGWRVKGNYFERNYQIVSISEDAVASITKKLWKLTDTYVIDIHNPQDALCVLMVVLAIDAEKCTRRK